MIGLKLFLLFAIQAAVFRKSFARKANRQHQQKVLLVSLDGFRADSIERYNLKNFKTLLKASSQAAYLEPQFSTQTFGNHWTLATGLYQESHGIISNKFYDPLFNETFQKSDKHLKWWNATEPIWYTAVRNNLKAGVYFWPGSEVIYFNTSQYSFYKYDDNTAFEKKVDQAIDWFANENYDFVAMYHPKPDNVGHRFGIDSIQYNETMLEVDRNIGYLIEKLKENKLYDSPNFNMIVLSDHGMINSKKIVLLDDYLNETEVTVLSEAGNNIHLNPKPGIELTYLLEKLKIIPNVTVFLKEEIPESWHFKNNRRVGSIFLVADEAVGLYSFIGRPTATRFFSIGEHGYRKSHASMQSIFIVKGPSFKTNFKSQKPLENVDVYPLACHLLSIECLPNNGSLKNSEIFFLSNSLSSFNFHSNFHLITFFISCFFLI